MNMYDEDFLMEELELAETSEEKKAVIIKILKQRPALKALMTGLILMEQPEQDKAIHVLNEALKPHEVSM